MGALQLLEESMRTWCVFVAVTLLATSASPAMAQLAQGELRGTIADESGAVLPGVAVTATHVETGTSRTTTTEPCSSNRSGTDRRATHRHRTP